MSSGIKTTSQFNTKIFYPKNASPNLWCSDQLNNVDFSDDKTNIYADGMAVELSEDGTTYVIKSMTNTAAVVNLTVKQTSPGFVVGTDGKTLYGDNFENPWGVMRHSFWPKASCEGSIMTKDGPIDFKGKAMFVHALQGMKPHHAAAKWNFVDFQGPTYSAVMMEYITPPSYGQTKVSVGGIAKDGQIIYAGAMNEATHTKLKTDDPNNEWPEPTDVKYTWSGESKEGKKVEGIIEGHLGERLDKVDVMAEVPKFVKQIVAGAVGTKPFIYQVCTHNSPLAASYLTAYSTHRTSHLSPSS